MPQIILFCVFGTFYLSGTQDAEVTKSLKCEMTILEIQTRDICTSLRGPPNCKDAWNETLQKWLLKLCQNLFLFDSEIHSKSKGRSIILQGENNVHLFKDLSNHFFHNVSSSKYFSKHTLILFSMLIPWYWQENLPKSKKQKGKKVYML